MDIKELLSLSLKHNASDLHLSSGIAPMLRVDGEMQKLEFAPLDNAQSLKLINQVMSKAQQQEFQQEKELDFSCEFTKLGRFRVNAFEQSRGVSAVFRVIPSQAPDLEKLNTPDIFQDFVNYPNGLVLITGPTGSGKSTTLAALINKINQEKCLHLLTVEDPIEFVHLPKQSLVSQREVKRDTHSFHRALKSALREDPDVILVGELRDKESISLALTAAETGHLVFATLHTSSAAKTIDRIVDVFSAAEKPMIRSMLSGSLRAVVSQKLIKKRGGGRTAAFEVMIANPAIRNLIREDKIAQMISIMQTSIHQGMQTMEQAIQSLVQKGMLNKI